MFLKCEIASKWSIDYFMSIFHTLCSLAKKKLSCLRNIQNKIILKSYKNIICSLLGKEVCLVIPEEKKMQRILQNISDIPKTWCNVHHLHNVQQRPSLQGTIYMDVFKRLLEDVHLHLSVQDKKRGICVKCVQLLLGSRNQNLHAIHTTH